MENLSKGFVYLVALSWAGVELLILSAHGTHWPLVLGILFFATGFVVIGCAPLKDATVDLAGRAFFSICALVCLISAIAGIESSALGILRVLAGIVVCVVAFRPTPAANHHSAASGH